MSCTCVFDGGGIKLAAYESSLQEHG